MVSPGQGHMPVDSKGGYHALPVTAVLVLLESRRLSLVTGMLCSAGAAPQPAYGAPAGYPAPGAYPGYAPVAMAQPAAPYPAVQPAGGSYQPFPTDKL